MFALAFKFGLVLTILAGSLGGTLAAAADSLPDSAIYPIKLAIEQAQLTLKNDSAGQATYLGESVDGDGLTLSGDVDAVGDPQDHWLVIFPEATFLRMPGMLPFRLGAFDIASATRTPLLPVVLRGTRSILRGGQWFQRTFNSLQSCLLCICLESTISK